MIWKIDGLLFAVLSFVLAGQIPEVKPTAEETRIFKVFSAQVQQYVKLRKDLESALPAMKQTTQVLKITGNQHELARQITHARRNSKQGEIFTPEVEQEFRKIIGGVFRGPKAQMARNTIRPDENPVAAVGLKVNDIRPDDRPTATMPPTLLSKLPPLPLDLAYLIVGHHFLLKDTKAGLIVDLIPNAVP